MSYFDDASLVMIPSGYKDQKVYSVKPIDGSGDLTFSRASSATRVNSSGLVEKVRTNLFTYSNTFTDASWVKTSATITANDAVSPDGTTNASRYEGTNATNAATKTTTAANGLYTFSIFVKRIATDNFRMNFSDNTTGEIRYVFNLSDETSTTTKSGGSISDFSTTYVAYPNGWYRLSIAAKTNSGSSIVTYFEADNELGSFYVYGAQLEQGDVMTDYIATTSSAVSVGPVSGLPRLDYSGGSTCPSLLLEPQTTALNQFSENFDNAYWAKARADVSANTTDTLDPSGYYGADKLTQQSGFTTAPNFNRTSLGSAATHTASIFAKKGTFEYLAISFNGVSYFNLADGTTGTTAAGHTLKIEDYGNGWYRCSVTVTLTGAVTLAFYPVSTNGTLTTPDNQDYAYFWGANLTATSYPQSYIPTYGTSVTRVADAASKTGISSLIGQTEGTLFAELKISSNDSTFKFLSLSDGTTSNSVWIYYRDTDNQINFRVIVGGVSQFDQIYTSPDSTTTHKLAIKYKQNDFSAWFNGTKVLTDTSGNTFSGSTLSEFDFFRPDGVNYFYGDIKQVLLFKTALTDAELAELTTL